MRTTCRHCDVVNDKDYGTCNYCGAPLHEDARRRDVPVDYVDYGTPSSFRSGLTEYSAGDLVIAYGGDSPTLSVCVGDGKLRTLSIATGDF